MFRRFLFFFLLVCIPVIALPQSKELKKKQKKLMQQSLTPEQRDLKMAVEYYTDGHQFTDDEIKELSRILRRVKFPKEWVKIDNKVKSNELLKPHEKRIYKKMMREREKVRRKLNKFWEKKKIPKDPAARKQYRKNLKKANEWNNLKKR